METPNTERLSRDGPEAERIGRLVIYAASLTDYNNGILHGRWIDAVEDEGVMAAEIDDMLADSPTRARTGEPAEEWAIHDHEGFEPYRLSEYANLGTIATLAAGITEYGSAFAAWAATAGDELDDQPLRRFEDAFLGEWASLSDYAEHLLGEFGLDELLDRVVPGSLRPYVQIDVEGFARDLELGGDITSVRAGSGVYVFQPET